MCEKSISKENLRTEQKIQNNLNSCFDQYTSFVFDAGAGSGKTYALVQCLEHLIKSKGNDLKMNNQKIICITYTNVATNNIKEKIGRNDIVLVSTIHERLWEIIKKQQPELLKIHKEALDKDIEENEKILTADSNYEILDDKDGFVKLIYENKNILNDIYTLNASEYRKRLPECFNKDYVQLTKNINKFKKLVSAVIRIKNDEECLLNIQNKQVGYNEVIYDSNYNRDRLYKMKISHDTLLEYSCKLIMGNPYMCRIIIDNYPYVLIDEYQDTSVNVIKIMKTLDDYAKSRKRNFIVGYFGDSVQNIYTDGVGNQLNTLHPGLKQISKEFNWRSRAEIITVANRIRNDEIQQVPIDDKYIGGTVKFYHGAGNQESSFIKKYQNKWEDVHVFSFKNEEIAELSGFKNLYNVFKKVYSGNKYDLLTSELLSKDLKKLGKAQLTLYRLLYVLIGVQDENNRINSVLNLEKMKINFVELKKMVDQLKNINGDSLNDLLQNIGLELENRNNHYLMMVFSDIFEIDKPISMESLINKFKQDLFDHEIDETIFKEFLNIEFHELCNWFNYIIGNNNYHTFHGTKGLEFENVVVIMKEKNGRSKINFKDYFKSYNSPVENVDTRNLLYVVVTRAISNLRILYIDDIDEIKMNIEKIFGDVLEYQE